MKLLTTKNCYAPHYARPYFTTLLFILLLFQACKKESYISPSSRPPGTTPVKDTLAQNIYTLSRSNALDTGNILVCVNASTDSSLLLIFDGSGHLLKQKKTRLACCFNRWNIGGQIRYTWIEDDPNAYHANTSYIEGSAVIADSSLNVLKRMNPRDFPNAVSDADAYDMHEFILLADDHYIAESYVLKWPNNIPDSLQPAQGVQVVVPVIQEVSNGQVVWEWDASNYPEFYGASAEGNDFNSVSTVQDYMHINAMTIDPKDNNLIVSFRNLNQIIKIDCKTGATLWRLGGKNSDFPLGSDQYFLRQHDATLTDNGQTLMLFDNGETKQRPYSRVLEFGLDENTKTVTRFKSFTIPEAFTAFMGSVQKKGTHYLIGGGTAGYVLEEDYNTGEKILEMKGPATYRAYKY